MTLAEYNQIIEKLEKCLNFYERIGIINNKYSLYLANGETLNIKFLKNNICHLLGVNLEYLKQSNRFKSDMNSFECLKFFVQESYSFSRLVNEGKLSFDLMFSKHINEKLDCFINNINIRTDDMHFILKYDNEKTYQLEDIPDISDYYIIRRHNNSYYVLGVVRSELNQNIYLPSTSRKYDDFIKFEDFIRRISKKQEITYPYLLKIENSKNDYKSNFSCSLDDKVALLNKIINLSEKYDATPSVAKDYLYSINKSINRKDNNFNNYNVLRLLTDCLKKGNVLDNNTIYEVVGDFEISEDIINLINVCNDVICSNENHNDAALNNYSKINEENENLKQELINLKEQLTKEIEEKENLQIINEELEKSNANYIEAFQLYENSYKKVKNLFKK